MRRNENKAEAIRSVEDHLTLNVGLKVFDLIFYKYTRVRGHSGEQKGTASTDTKTVLQNLT